MPTIVIGATNKKTDFDSKRENWHEDTDSLHADSVDLASWSGHSNYGLPGDGWHFFRKNWFCAGLERSETSLGDSDSDWLIFDTCLSLYASLDDLKNQLLTDGRCAHMFLGFWSCSSWKIDSGEYFAERLKEVGIKQAWFNYCQYKQKPGTYVRVFYAEDCNDESLAGPGPIEIRRDPTNDSTWTYEDYPPPPP